MVVRALALTGSIEVGEVLHHMGHNDVFTSIHIPHIIMKLINPIFPSSIYGGSVEEGSVGISFSEPGDFGFSFPKILVTF